MRMRFKPYAHDELMAADFHVHEPLIWGGKWHAQYARPEQPFVLELGCGKGGFISQLACAHPEKNYMGIEITDKVSIHEEIINFSDYALQQPLYGGCGRQKGPGGLRESAGRKPVENFSLDR